MFSAPSAGPSNFQNPGSDILSLLSNFNPGMFSNLFNNQSSGFQGFSGQQPPSQQLIGQQIPGQQLSGQQLPGQNFQPGLNQQLGQFDNQQFNQNPLDSLQNFNQPINQQFNQGVEQFGQFGQLGQQFGQQFGQFGGF